MKIYATLLVGMLLVLLGTAGCVPTPDTVVDIPGSGGGAAGFWQGLWHGFILLFTFIVSLFADNVGIYEAHNTGNLYNLGFLIGVAIFFGGGSGGACKKVR